MSQKSQPADEGEIEPTLEECTNAVGHRWETVDVRLRGRGGIRTYLVEQCDICNGLRVNYDAEVLGEVGK